jgi:hypothetical protein
MCLSASLKYIVFTANAAAPRRTSVQQLGCELERFSEKLRLMLTFEGDPLVAQYLLDEWPESLPYMAHSSKPTIPFS